MVICHTCHKEHEGPLKTCPSCREKIAAWKLKYRWKDLQYKRKYIAKKRRIAKQTGARQIEAKSVLRVSKQTESTIKEIQQLLSIKERRDATVDDVIAWALSKHDITSLKREVYPTAH